jgi:hypothetical protein
LFFLLGQYLVWGGLVLGLLQIFRGQLHAVIPAEFRAAVAAQPWWVQAVEVVLLSDLVIYWGHRLQYRIGFLWRFHSIHFWDVSVSAARTGIAGCHGADAAKLCWPVAPSIPAEERLTASNKAPPPMDLQLDGDPVF